MSRIRRRGFAAACLLLLGTQFGGCDGRPRRPHVVVLLWDTTRADRLSAYGYEKPTTPWLESVARRGVLYEQCRAPSPWTLPSHASLFTGRLPSRHGATAVDSVLAPAHATLAERLAGAGYDTMLVSNNLLVGPETGLDQGFAVVHEVEDEHGNSSGALTVEVIRSLLAEREADSSRAAKPLFLFVNLMEPHLPYDPPEDLERPWRAADITDAEIAAGAAFEPPAEFLHNLGHETVDDRGVSVLSHLYDAEVRELDGYCAQIERVLTDGSVLGPESMLIVTSDHGENLGEHGLLDHKLSVAESLLHVPLVVHWPGRLDGGRSVTEQVRLQDLFPTILEAAGVAPDGAATPRARSLVTEPLAGRPAIAQLTPPPDAVERMRQTFPFLRESVLAPLRLSFRAVVEPAQGATRRKWVAVERPGPGGSSERVRTSLYDLAKDPGELEDLLAASPTAEDREAARRLAGIARDAE